MSKFPKFPKFLQFLPFLLLLSFLPACAQSEIQNPQSKIEFLGTFTLPTGFDAQGHRAARGLRPENTLPAIETALDLGVTTLELDLHYTQDGHVVIWHDPIISRDKCRLAENPHPDAPDPRNPLRRILISQQPLEIIQSYQCDLNPDSGRYPDQEPAAMPLSGTNYHIPTLSELFEFVDNYVKSGDKSAEQVDNAAQILYNLETKRNPDHPEYIDDGFTGGEAGPFELALLDEITGRNLTHRVTIQSFDHRSLRTIRAINPDIQLAALTRNGEAKLKVYWGYQFNIWSPNHNDVTPERVAEAQELGLQVIPWTINDPATMRTLINMNVDGLITDRPDILLSLENEE